MSENNKPPETRFINVHENIAVGENEPEVELWMAGNFASAWFEDAKRQAAIDDDNDDMVKPREIVFAVCAIESYLLEWVRDEVLNRNFQLLKHYFPIATKQRYLGIDERWKEVINHLYEDQTIFNKPSFGEHYWEQFRLLIDLRNGLLHGRASRPDNARLPPDERPLPTITQLVHMSQGWPVQVVAEVIRKLHSALGTLPPKWIST
jgi:hypothetical protein